MGLDDAELNEKHQPQKLNMPPDTSCSNLNETSKDNHQCTSPNIDHIKPFFFQIHVIPDNDARLNKNSPEPFSCDGLVTFTKHPDLPLPNDDFRNEVTVIPLVQTI